MKARVEATPDAYVGLVDPGWEEWRAWHRAMLDERARILAEAGFEPTAYDDPATAWSDTSFRQLFLFMYDTSFYDRGGARYRTAELVDRWVRDFGRVDSVLLWHAYPRLGFDRRTQFDFYRDMPGGLSGLASGVSDVLHARGIRVFVDYNPWDAGSYEELGEIVGALDADGVMLDTMTDAPEALARAVNLRRRGVVFAPELRPLDRDLRHLRQSWAQWSEIGDEQTPSIYRQRWLVPRHRQFAIRRWDRSRRRDIVYSFFNGAGLILWDNVFGSMNPYSAEDRRLIAETAAVLDHYQDLFCHGEWWPLVPTGHPGLDANLWTERASGKSILTLRNRTKERLAYRVPADAPPGLAYAGFWGDRSGDTVAIEPEGVQALVLDDPAAITRARAHFDRSSTRAGAARPEDAAGRPPPRLVPVPVMPSRDDGGFVDLPPAHFEMTIRHERRECGCTPLGAAPDATWGWFYRDTITHRIPVTMGRYAIRATAVTNADFIAFVHASGYRPDDARAFLAHLARSDGTLPQSLPEDAGALPVTFVSLGDARAYAAFRGERLPTEAEWQWAAEGAGEGRRFPWGDEERTFLPAIRPAFDRATATPQGVMGLSGNTWELTESEHTDGHTRFVMLRGGIFLPPGESEWLVPRGARPNDFHAKYLLLADGLDRSETISFRTVIEGEPTS